MISAKQAISQLMDQKAAAEFIGVMPRTLENWRARRIGPKFLSYSRRMVRYRVADLLLWQASKEVVADVK